MFVAQKRHKIIYGVICATSSTMSCNEQPHIDLDLEDPPPSDDTSNMHGRFHMRWSRLVKKVQVKETTEGLMRGSISTPTQSSRRSTKSGPSIKAILEEVSGSAKPGEVLAMMGASGALFFPSSATMVKSM